MTVDQKIELAAIASGGAWSLTTVLLFATGRMQSAYAMLAIGTVLTTALGLVRVASSPRLAAELETGERHW